MLKNFIKRLAGVNEIEAELAGLRSEVKAAEEFAARKSIELEEVTRAAEKEKAVREAELAQSKKTPKEIATERNEPWVGVVDTKVNPENPRNGFFELDWNHLFILQLRRAGYGYDGDPDEEIVDRWFRDLAYHMLQQEGIDPSRTGGAGFINVIPLSKGRSEVS
jgi:hypothetical protein